MAFRTDNIIIWQVDLEGISKTDHGFFCGQQLFSDYDLELQNEIADIGIQTPLVLYWDNNILKIYDGWHRFKAAQVLKFKSVPAVIFPDKESCYPTENLQW